MVQHLYHLKTLLLRRFFGFYLTFSSTFASKTSKRRFVVVGDIKPSSSHFTLQNRLLCRYLASSEISANQQQQDEDNFSIVNYLINSCGLLPDGAISASKRVQFKSPERPDSVLALLRNHCGLSETQISKVVRSFPKVLLANPEKTLLPKLEFFRSTVGVSREDLAKILAYNPMLLSMSLEKRIVPTYDFLRSLLSEKKVVSVLKCGSRIFIDGHWKDVVPNIGLLRELGMPQSRISLLLAHNPAALTQRPEKFVQVVDEVKLLGFDLQKSTSMKAIIALYSCNSKLIWNRNRQVYMRWGWSEDDVLSAFRKNPECMYTSEKKIMRVLKFLVEEVGWPSRMIAKNPGVMFYSLEKRIIPRCSVVKVLSSRGLIDEIEKLNLGSFLQPVEKLFLKRFVARYIDEVPHLLSMYQGKAKVEDV